MKCKRVHFYELYFYLFSLLSQPCLTEVALATPIPVFDNQIIWVESLPWIFLLKAGNTLLL